MNALGFWATRITFGGLTGAVLYVGYSALISFLVFVLTGEHLLPSPSVSRLLTLYTGTIGFFASYAFVHRIYGSIKVD